MSRIKDIVRNNLESIKLEFEQLAKCKVVAINESIGAAGVEIMIIVNEPRYEPHYFTSIKQVGKLHDELSIIGFVDAKEFNVVRDLMKYEPYEDGHYEGE